MATEYFLPAAGGVKVHTYELSKRLLDMGHEVHILAPRIERVTFTDKKYVLDGITIHRFCGFRIPGLCASFNVFSPFKLKEFFKQEKFDVVHSQHIFTPMGLIAASAASEMHPRVECVVATTHSIYGAGMEGLIFKIWKRMLRKSLHKIDRLIAVSKSAAKAVLPIIDRRKIAVIPNGVDVHKFSPGNKGSLHVEGPIVMSIGRLVKVKGFTTLLESARNVIAEFPTAKFIIVGKGKMRKDLEGLAKKLGIEKNVRLLGERRPDEIPHLIASCDVFALASMKESQGMVLLEAMASGKPVVGTKVNGILDTIQDGKTGLLVRPGDSKQLAAAIKKLLLDINLAKKLGKAARKEAVEKHSWERVAKQTCSLYKHVLEEKRCG